MIALVGKEGRNTSGSVRGIVVRELRQGKELGPVVLLVVQVDPEVLLKGLVDLLGLTVAFRVVTGGEVKAHVEGLTEGAEEVRDELRTPVGGNVRGNSVLGEHIEYEQVC